MTNDVGSGNSLSLLLCRVDRHDYEPQYTVSMDVIGLGDEQYPLRMRWRCARCGDEITLPAGVSP
jgi:hypothetical protein